IGVSGGAAMNCRECSELLVSHLEGVLFQREEALVAQHLESCLECQNELKAATALRDRLLRGGQRAKAAGFTTKVMSNIPLDKDFTKVKEKNMFQRHPFRISLAAAAVIATVVSLVAVLTPRAYALSDTLEANQHITSLHFLNEVPGSLKADANGKLTYEIVRSISEGWAEYGENGELLRLRIEFPFTEDGAKVVVWQNGKATVWFKDKKGLAVVPQPSMERKVGELRQSFDPKLVMERLKEAESKKKVQISTQEVPEWEQLLPIVLIAQWSEPADLREVYLVDRKTNLVQQIETFAGKGGNMVFTGRRRFLDYNQPIPASVFTLNPPGDILRVDETTQKIGLEKGNLSDNEIAQKVAREFFEALIAKDYTKAGQLFSGIPGPKMEEMLAKTHWHFVRIVSVSQPVPMEIPGVGGVRVPCEIELEVDEVKTVRTFSLAIRAVYNQPDRWEIHGGF
ncbi:MAG: hypothetical protein WCA89_04555, partial [Terracidiphilus sp.]